jgi:hypothetical protein
MQIFSKYRIPAVLCALAVLLCELIAHPYTTMGVCDDGPYIVVARNLASTGHLVYNGWSAAMLGWQLCLGAVFIKLFGLSPTTVRFSTLIVSMATAFVLQRTIVRAGCSERNATVGTLALVLSPLYLLLSVTFMSDIHGLFALTLCLYGCLRALQSSTSRAAIAWLCFAVATNVVCGTSRQLAWLGTLVMVPCALWLLRAQRKVLFTGAAATFAGALCIMGCLHWFRLQPNTQSEHLGFVALPTLYFFQQFSSFFLDFPFLLLPLVVLFLPQTRATRLRILALTVLVIGILMALIPSHVRGNFAAILEPTFRDWITPSGEFDGSMLKGGLPVFLHPGVRSVLTLVSLGGLLGLIASFFNAAPQPQTTHPLARPSWKSLGILLAPFSLAYTLLLVYRALSVASAGTPDLLDRYALGLLLVAALVTVRYYQDRIQPRLPLAAFAFVAVAAAYGVVVTHNTFAFYRARVALAAELQQAGVPATSVDSGWEYNIGVELQQAGHINNPENLNPAYVPPPPPPPGPCNMFWYNYTPHIHPLYAIALNPAACAGPAPFAPVHYSRWPYQTPGALYVVLFTDDDTP